MKLIILFVFSFSISALAQAPTLITDFNPGEANAFNDRLESITINKKIILPVITEEHGEELGIISDGALSLLKDINPNIESSSPRFFTRFNDKIYFSAIDDENGGAIWSTDGTEEGTQLEFDPNESISTRLSMAPSGLTATGSGYLYYTADEVLYRTDGTSNEVVFYGVSFRTLFNQQNENYLAYQSDVAFLIINRDENFDDFIELHIVEGDSIRIASKIPVESSFDDPFGLQEVENGLIFSNAAFDGLLSSSYFYNATTQLTEPVLINDRYFARTRAFNKEQALVLVQGNGYYLTNGIQGEETVVFDSDEPSTTSGTQFPLGIYQDKFIAVVTEGFFGDDFYIYYDGESASKLFESQGHESKILIKENFAFFADGTSNGARPIIHMVDMLDGSISQLYSYEERSLDINSVIMIGVIEDQLYFASNIDDTVGRELFSLQLSQTVNTEEQIFNAQFDTQLTPTSLQVNSDNNETLDIRFFSIDGRQVGEMSGYTNTEYTFEFEEKFLFINIRTGNSSRTYKVPHFR